MGLLLPIGEAFRLTPMQAVASFLLVFRRPRTPPWTLLIFYCSIIIVQMVVLTNSHHVLRIEAIPDVLATITAFAAVGIIMCMPLRHPRLLNDDISVVFELPISQLRSPEDNLTLWQFFTVAWMRPLISIGKKRQIDDEDVWSLAYEFQHKRLFDHFRRLKGSVLMRLLKANGIDLIIMTILALVELLGRLAVPVLLQQILKAMENPLAPTSAAITYALLTWAVTLIATQSAVLDLWYSRRAYERSRGEMITMLYEKTLTRKIVRIDEKDNKDEGDPTKSKESASMGKIMNLMRFDSYEVSQRFWEFPYLIFQPAQLVLSILLIWRVVGWSSLAGVAAVVIAQVINAGIARVQLIYEKKRRAATDEKLKRISQFVEAIRHLRWYGWQDTWIGQIMVARQKELKLRIVVNLWRNGIRFVDKLASGLFPVIAFYAYTVWAGKPLTVDVAFPALQLFAMLDTAIQEIPDLITVVLNAQVALGRLEAFMAEPNKDDNAPQPSSETLKLNRASFAWPGAADYVLKDVSLTFQPGLTVVCGEVAAGKTALLQALLGELDLREGELDRPGEAIGYCAQTPWLESMSIRDNILFAAPFDKTRYQQVLDACALAIDLANFKSGDLSNIGENGIGLSGGQKARVALARAVYSQAKIIFLDDPLSALDSQTAETIVRRCIAGPLLKGRITVLVTHRTELCYTLASQVVEVSHGVVRVLDPGTDLSHGLSKTLSVGSQDEVATEKEDDKIEPEEAEKAIEEEYRAHGGVNFSVYWEYIKAGKLKWWGILLFVLCFYRLIDVLETWILKSWGEAYNRPDGEQNPGFHFGSDPFASLPSPEKNVRPWLIWYFLIAAAEALFFIISQSVMLVIIYVAGKQMFRDMIQRVSQATFRYYDVTPIGRLMNRLTSDANTIDGNISLQFSNVARLSLVWLVSLLVIASVTPVFLAFSLALTLAFVLIFRQFLPTSQSLRRLEMVSLSPLMSNFGALLEGLTTVRAYAAQERFLDRLINVVDTFQKMDHFYWSLQAWLIYRFDALAATSTLLLTLIALSTGVSAGLTAFVLTASSKFVTATHGLCRAYGSLQMDFVSVERVVELLHLEQEPPGSIDPPASWPRYTGDIVFENVTMRYAPHLDPALEDVSFTIKAGSSTALLGRTGSGKSTLALSLLATILPEKGRILIDGIDIATVNTHALRSRITFLAQEPVLFPGSIRMNLDPLEAHTDAECSRVLAKIAGRHGWTLTTTIDAGGKNLSQGQRQLVGLARAMLRRSSIVIFDEATASIDTVTARGIQELLREELAESTVITIAHRLEAVRGATDAVVLRKGRVLRRGTREQMSGDLGGEGEGE
jgi:ABC-type multidrug transport system fused ATPase/permease subunit